MTPMPTMPFAAPPTARRSIALVWTLLARSVGLAAGVALALLMVALLMVP
jgi:hypothetical protein